MLLISNSSKSSLALLKIIELDMLFNTTFIPLTCGEALMLVQGYKIYELLKTFHAPCRPL